MLTSILKGLFLISATGFASMLSYGKLFVFKKKHPAFVSDYCATMAGFIAFYSVFALVLAWLLPSTSTKLIMFGFAFSPFMLGLVATYHTEKYFTFLQIILILLSMAFVIIK